MQRRFRSHAACDQCRFRKVKCDSDDIPAGKPCSKCLSSELDCTFTYKRKKRKPNIAMHQAAKALISAQVLIEEILSAPNSYIPPTDSTSVRDIILSLARYARSIEERLARSNDTALIPLQSPPTDDYTSDDDVSSDDDDPNAASFRQLSLGHSSDRHFGESSNFRFLHNAMNLGRDKVLDLTRFRRPEYWGLEIWQLRPDPPPVYTFPELDLLWQLIHVYFAQIAPYVPLLHRPTFERAVMSGSHLFDDSFGAVVLLVCALAARFSEDPRTLLQDTRLTMGYRWFRQVRLVRSNFVEPASVHELQLYCLAYSYLQGTNMWDSAWTLTGLAIRLAIDRGIHRLKTVGAPTIESELCVRAFWILRNFDIIQSVSSGRPTGIISENFDLDNIAECDDEYWEKTEHNEAFKQPIGKISLLSFFTHYNQLMDIAASVQRNIYPIKQSELRSDKTSTSTAERSRQKVMKHDSALNEWLTSLPDHLRWDPHQPNKVYLTQSAILFVSYYWVQMQLHRKFIVRPGSSNQHTFPSLAISANAAKSSVRVLQVLQRRVPKKLADTAMHLSQCIAVLMLILWREKRGTHDLSTDIRAVASDVEAALDLLAAAEARSQTIGRIGDKLRAFIAIEGLLSDLPSQSKPKLKRTRADESEQMGLLNSSVAKPQRATSYATDSSKEIAESLLVPSNNLEFISAWNLDGAPTQSTLVSNYSGMSDSEVDLAAEEAHALAEKDLQTSIDHFIHSPISDPLETLPSSYFGDVERLHSPIRPHESVQQDDWDNFMRNVDEVLLAAGLS
ncbi:hypothetical protein GYMLUDRAFT_34227 [Collybiopsis luxurians FD-317 M1]|nr:hypothetical protein GYMLUDRAFT_34227 [Collybiopsis luxurians FD-317 M1]